MLCLLLVPQIAVSVILNKRMYSENEIPAALFNEGLIPREAEGEALIKDGQVLPIILVIIALCIAIPSALIITYAEKK